MLENNFYHKKEARYFLPKILLIEDDEATADALQLFFQMTGHLCEVMLSGLNVLIRVKQMRPSVIIIDYILPGCSGTEICRELKQDKQTHTIPLILYSAYPNILSSSEQFGYDAFVAKPFNLDDMLEKVTLLLERHPSGHRSQRMSSTHI